MADLDILQNNDVVIPVTVKDSSGVVVDLTGYTANFYLVNYYNEDVSSAIVTKSVGSGITVTDAVAGELEVALSKTDTDRLGVFYLQLDVLDSASNKSTVLQKSVEFTATVN
jgi:hypothetical protein